MNKTENYYKFSTKNIKVYLLSLGCSKNLVDSEGMIGILEKSGYKMVLLPEDANVIIVNTCGFIQSAKEEAINAILQMAEYKIKKSNINSSGKLEFLIVAGCLAQRYSKEISTQIPEVDAIIGTDQYVQVAETICELYSLNTKTIKGPIIQVDKGDNLSHLDPFRKPSTLGYAYLKIAEGCSNNCTYCAIPSIRGPFRSRPMEELVKEAQNLSDLGYYEIVLIAQDTTRYGLDIYGERRLTKLLKQISEIDGIKKIRLLYCYCDGITSELIDEIANNTKIAKYIDMPIQHISDRILKLMNRKDTSKSIKETIQNLRTKVPDITLRTTIITGFPGETKKDFEELLSFLKNIKFDLLGCFVYSREEGTAAFNLKQKVSNRQSKAWYEMIMSQQKEISSQKNKSKVGKEIQVRVESIDQDGVFYLGRSDAEAPEIDPPIYIVSTEEELKLGNNYMVRIVDYSDYDLTGVTC